MGEHYGRTSSGELIGPYDTVAELERELAESEREIANRLAAQEQADLEYLRDHAYDPSYGGWKY